MVTSSIKEDEVPQVQRNPWADNFFRPLVITVMITCLSIALVNLVRQFNPAWRGTYFLLGMVLTTVEAIYSYRILRQRRVRGLSLLRFRLAEALCLVLLLKIFSFAEKSPALIWAEIQLIWQDPSHFINIEFYMLLFLAAMAWLAATSTVVDFEDLHDPYTFYSDTILPLDSLAGRFFWGGLLLVLMSGLTQWLARAEPLANLLDLRRPSLAGVSLNVLVYFTLGLVLLSQVHLTVLLTRWQIQKVTVAPGLARQWARYGVIALGLILLVVFVLPTGYSLGFLTSAGYFISLVMGVIVIVMQLLFFLLALPLVWLLSLMGQEPLPPQIRPPLQPFRPENLGGGAPIPWLEVIRSLLFWLVIGLVSWYLLRAYWSDHPELGQSLRRFKPAGWLLDWLGLLWRRLLGLGQAGWDMLPKRLWAASPSPGGAARRRWRWAGLGSLSPREKILYYYLNILQRTGRRGPTRRGAQTPYEFEPALSQAVPEAEPEVHILTQAFVHARYSQDSFTEDQAGLARTLWRRIRQELTRRREEKE